MNKFLMAVAIAGLSATAAQAADMPVKAPAYKAPPVVINNWSGLYLGLNAGGASQQDCWTVTAIGGTATTPLNEGCRSTTGGLAGGQIGYRWQTANLVFGVEAQGDWANLKGSTPSAIASFLVINESTVKSLGLFTGQIGYAWNNVLLYAKGGAAMIDTRFDSISTTNPVGFPAGSRVDQATDARWSGTIGTGLEFRFAPHWSLGFEYNHIFANTKTLTTTYVEGPPIGLPARTEAISQHLDMGTVRLNYTFGAPVLAKY